jgi:hypothetical protein
MLKSPPKLLGEAIKRQRLVPRDFILPEFDLDRLIWDSDLEIPVWGSLDYLGPPSELKLRWVHPAIPKAERDLDILVRSLPSGLRRHLRKEARRGESRDERFYSLVDAYDEFHQERRAVIAIAHVAKHVGSALEIPAVRLRTIEDAKGSRLPDVLMHPLYGEIVSLEVDLSYVRECEIQKCRKIFWAGRKEQTGCSPPCQRAIRDRRHLDKKNKNKKKESHPRRRPMKHEKMTRVRNALGQGRALTRDEISRQTRLSDNEISKVIGDLNKEYDQVKSRLGAAGERVFYVTRSAKKGK